MSTTLTGEVGVYGTTGDPTFATGTVPTNGDDVDAPVVITLVQRLLDFDAQLAFDVNGLYEQVTARIDSGVPILRNVASIAALKALSTGATPDGGVAVVKETVVASNVISRLAMFVYDATSVLPECPIPNITDAYVVVMPNSGTGRWINVAAGLGWDGFTGEFQPKPRERVVRWQIAGAGPTITTTSLVTGGAWTQISPVVAPVLALNDDFDFDFDFSTGPVAAADNYVFFRVDVSYNGGAFTPVTGAKKTISTSSTNVLDWQSVHIGGRITASLGAGTYTLRVFGSCGTVNADTFIAGEWVARGIQYVAL